MHIALGIWNTLTVVKRVDFGIYLDGGDDGEILLPTRYVPDHIAIGDELAVFIYLDNEERLIATTQIPLVQVQEFACLTVAWVNQYGAFLHWGLMKDLFVPFGEQKQKMVVGSRHIVHCHLDEDSYRIVASAKVERYLSKALPPYKRGACVDILVWHSTPLGYKVIVDNQFSGMLYNDGVYQPLHMGDRLTAYVKQVRTDGKIDLELQPMGAAKVVDFATTLLQYLQENGGFAPYHDRSSAQEIYDAFGVSKKTFKKAVGDLYKRRLIALLPDGLKLL